MRKSTKKLYFFTLLLLLPFPSLAFVSLDFSYDRFTNDAIESANTSLSGLSYRASVGFDTKFPLFIFLSQSSLSGIVNHDNSNHTIGLTTTSYGIKTAITLSKRFYINLGYGFHDLEYDLPETNSFTLAGIIDQYDLNDSEAEGIIYGIGYNLYRTESSQLFLEYNVLQFSEIDASSTSIAIGYRMRKF